MGIAMRETLDWADSFPAYKLTEEERAMFAEKVTKLDAEIASLALNAARGEQPETSALPKPGALRGDVPLSITDQREV